MPIDLTALIDHHAQLPKYIQLAVSLREAIDDGRLTPGEELPSEQRLIEATDVSRDTVRKAIGRLANEGIVIVRHGAPTKVAEAAPQRAVDASRYAKTLRLLKSGQPHPLTSAFTEDHGITWDQYKVEMQVAIEPATAEDARRLLLPEGSDLLRRRFVKYAKGQPMELQRSAISWKLAGGTPLIDPGQQPWPGGTIAELFSLGLEVTRVTHDAEARMPRDDERKALRMQKPGPVISMVRVFWVGERPVEASRVISPGDRAVLHYEVELDLSEG